ncbi:hypothetical protein BV25DRAFT_1577239 [Artomyces pyxidatus]|uniref:Uncharacterized protein n=1 Tax=Artomyces pyxidatus TaxID=48021 RepID=A0ACB8SL15_9AGAM|nr:hypothetical protein BV25DRAFT_1577239 [Artomyces pyxidatus]
MRPLPSFALSSDPCTLILESALQEGMQWASQVWIAHVVYSNASNHAGPPELAVVEFIQPSMLCIPSAENRDWVGRYVSPRAMALSEDCIYRTLRLVRGSAVPHYLGLHQVRMPNGESAWMLVLEHIQGSTLDQWRLTHAEHVDPDIEGKCTLSLADFEAWMHTIKDMATMILKSIDAVHAQNLLHKDIRPSNLIFHNPASGPRQVVVIDFGLAVTSINGPRRTNADRKSGLGTLRCCKEHTECIKAFTTRDLQGLSPPSWGPYQSDSVVSALGA